MKKHNEEKHAPHGSFRRAAPTRTTAVAAPPAAAGATIIYGVSPLRFIAINRLNSSSSNSNSSNSSSSHKNNVYCTPLAFLGEYTHVCTSTRTCARCIHGSRSGKDVRMCEHTLICRSARMYTNLVGDQKPGVARTCRARSA